MVVQRGRSLVRLHRRGEHAVQEPIARVVADEMARLDRRLTYSVALGDHLRHESLAAELAVPAA